MPGCSYGPNPAELTGAEVICMLVGERPGLVTAESMSAYLAHKPTVGMPEAETDRCFQYS